MFRLLRRRSLPTRPVPPPTAVPRTDVPLTTPGPEPVDAPEVVRSLMTMRALGLVGWHDQARVTALAAQAVALGLDGPATVDLAAHYPTDDRERIDTALVACLEELGWDTARTSYEDAAVHLTRGRAFLLLAGTADGRWVATWVDDRFTWDDRIATEAFSVFTALGIAFAAHERDDRNVEPDPVDTASAFLRATSDVSARWRVR